MSREELAAAGVTVHLAEPAIPPSPAAASGPPRSIKRVGVRSSTLSALSLAIRTTAGQAV